MTHRKIMSELVTEQTTVLPQTTSGTIPTLFSSQRVLRNLEIIKSHFTRSSRSKKKTHMVYQPVLNS